MGVNPLRAGAVVAVAVIVASVTLCALPPGATARVSKFEHDKLMRRASTALSRGDAAGAVQAARAASRADPDSTAAFHTLAFALNKRMGGERATYFRHLFARQQQQDWTLAGDSDGAALAGDGVSSASDSVKLQREVVRRTRAEYLDALRRALVLSPLNAQIAYELGMALIAGDVDGTDVDAAGAMAVFAQARDEVAKLLDSAATATTGAAATSTADVVFTPSSCAVTFQARALTYKPQVLGPGVDPDALMDAFVANVSAALSATAAMSPLALPSTMEWTPQCHLAGPIAGPFPYFVDNSRPAAAAAAQLYASVLPFMAARQGSGLEPRPRGHAGRDTSTPLARVGFVASRLSGTHPLAKSFDGLIARIGRMPPAMSPYRGRIAVTVISLGGQEPPAAIAQRAERSGPSGIRLLDTHDLSLPDVADSIADLELDLLVYVDIGLAEAHSLLALSRLAPRQAVMWGHPATSGMPAIDDFLGSDVEAADADEQYTERLVRLKSMGIYFNRPDPPAKPSPCTAFGFAAALASARAARGASGDRPRDRSPPNVYLCPQTLFKIHPRMDDVFSRILEADPDGVVGLIATAGNQAFASQVAARLDQTMRDLDARRRVVIVPTTGPHHNLLAPGGYASLLQCATVMLDSFPFGGGTTSLEALALGVPVVTRPSRALCGRQTLKYYRTMRMAPQDDDSADAGDWGGGPPLAVPTLDGYVTTAVTVATNAPVRDLLSRHILARVDALYDDAEAVLEWERYIVHGAETDSSGLTFVASVSDGVRETEL